MKKLLVFVLALVSVSAFANLQGKWTGWGEWKYQGSGVGCYTFLNFSENDKVLKRLPTAFDCQVAVLHILEETWEKQGESLVINGEVVSTVQNDHYMMTEQYDENVTIKTDIKVEGNHLDYKEMWYDQGQELYEITGRLFRKQ